MGFPSEEEAVQTGWLAGQLAGWPDGWEVFGLQLVRKLLLMLLAYLRRGMNKQHKEPLVGCLSQI